MGLGRVGPLLWWGPGLVGEEQVKPKEGLVGPRPGSAPWRDLSVPLFPRL